MAEIVGARSEYVAIASVKTAESDLEERTKKVCSGVVPTEPRLSLAERTRLAFQQSMILPIDPSLQEELNEVRSRSIAGGGSVNPRFVESDDVDYYADSASTVSN